MGKFLPYIGIAVAVGVGITFAPLIGFLFLVAVAYFAFRALGRWPYWPFLMLGACILVWTAWPDSIVGAIGRIVVVWTAALIAWHLLKPWLKAASRRFDRYLNEMGGS